MEDDKTTTDVTAKESTGWIESLIITTVQTSVGQTLFKYVDSFLWVVEKSAQWSLPAQEIAAEESGKIFGKIELVRPLPWFLFLPGLVILRIIRVGLNVGAYILGYPRIQASGMVKLVQRSRRRLRAINLKAVKSRRRMFNKDKTMIEAKKALIKSIRLTLSTLSCLDTSKSSHSPPPTKIRISRMDFEPAPTSESVGSPIHQDAKRKYSQLSLDDESIEESENETTRAKLERLADFDSADDISFNPIDCSTSSTGSSECETNKEVSITELNELQQEAEELLGNSENKIEDGNKDLPVNENAPENVEPNSKNVEKTEDSVEQDVDSSESQKTSCSVDKDSINGKINSTDEVDKGTTVKPGPPKVTLEVTSEVTSEVTPKGTPEVTSEAAPEVTPEIKSEVTPKVKSKVTLEVTPEIKSEVISEVIPEVTPKGTPEVTLEAAPEVIPEIKSEVTPKVKSKVTLEVTSEMKSEVISEVIPEVTPEVTPKGTPEVTLEAAPEVTPEVKSKVTLEVTPEIKSEVTSEVIPEIKSEVTSEAIPEVKSEVTPEVTPEVTNRVIIEKQTPQSIPIPSSDCTLPEATARTRVNSANFQEKKSNRKKHGRHRDSK